jgi:YHS domain-containing protein
MTRRHVALLFAWLMAGLAFGPGALADGVETRLALKGYDAVAYFTESHPVKGDPRLEYRFDGAVYRFSSARHLELFKVDPDRYLPQYGGICTAALAKGKRAVANPEYWIIQDGRLHVFAEQALRNHSFDSHGRLMSRNPAAMKAKADKNWARLSELPWAASPQNSAVGQ